MSQGISMKVTVKIRIINQLGVKSENKMFMNVSQMLDGDHNTGSLYCAILRLTLIVLRGSLPNAQTNHSQRLILS